MARAKKKSTSFERFNNARAEKFELDNRKTKRELISRDEIQVEFDAMISHIKYGFQSLPSRMARTLVGIDDPTEIYEIIEKDIERIFSSIADLGAQLEAEAELLSNEEEPEEEEPEAELLEALEEGGEEPEKAFSKGAPEGDLQQRTRVRKPRKEKTKKENKT